MSMLGLMIMRMGNIVMIRNCVGVSSWCCMRLGRDSVVVIVRNNLWLTIDDLFVEWFTEIWVVSSMQIMIIYI